MNEEIKEQIADKVAEAEEKVEAVEETVKEDVKEVVEDVKEEVKNNQVSDKTLRAIVFGIAALLIVIVLYFALNAYKGSTTISPDESSNITFNMPNEFYDAEGTFYKASTIDAHKLEYAGGYGYYSLSEVGVESYEDFLAEFETYYNVEVINDNVAYIEVDETGWHNDVYLVNDADNSAILEIQVVNCEESVAESVINSLNFGK